MSRNEKLPLEKVRSGDREYLAYRMPYQNLYETLEASARRFPDKTAIIDGDRCVRYLELKQETDAFAAYLYHCKGVRKGDHIALIMVNSIEFCICFYAILKIGATVVSVNTKLSGDEIDYITRDSGVKFAITDRSWFEKLSRHQPSPDSFIFTSDAPEGSVTVREAIEAGLQLPETPTLHDDSLPADIMYTSGTTGKPKGAVMTHFNLLQSIYVYVEADDMTSDEITVLAVPAFHITGLNNILTVFVFIGGTIVMLPFFNAEKTLEAITQYHVTYLHAVATVFMMLEGAVSQEHDLSSLKTALCGGGFISRKTVENFCAKAVNCRFHPVYGMTETSGAGTYFPVHCLDSDIVDSCGKTSANCEIRIVDENNQLLPPNTLGEICFRGAYVIDHYLNDASPESFTDGWLHSGDVGYFDEEGYLYIKDRIKDMINRGGEKIFSLAVEDVIMKFGGIKQAAVLGVNDELYGEVPYAVIVPEAGVEVSIPDLKEYVRDHIAHYKVPVYFEVRDQLPVTASGKPRKFELRQEFNRRRLAGQ